MRYAVLKPARQSSAAVRRYVCFSPGTGLLRTCNLVRIAGLPVLRKDGAPRAHHGQGRASPCPVPAQCAGTVDGVASCVLRPGAVRRLCERRRTCDT
ncbi:MAG: hypothetical protein LBM98_11190 [Oscillospiraceae bacterium]|nr:hypothetical protein [Oscillospiraceae bacterium]